MTDHKKFWDKAARKYAASPIKDMAAYDYTLGRTRSYLGAGDHVLELGCGTGNTALALAGGVARYTGTDLSGEMIAIAREHAMRDGMVNATFRDMDARDALRDAQGLGAVLGFNLFHLTADAPIIFAAIHRALSHGGVFISKTPCLAEPSIGWQRFAFAALIPAMRAVGLAPFVKRYTFATLEAQIEAAGFEIVESGNFPASSRYIVARKT